VPEVETIATLSGRAAFAAKETSLATKEDFSSPGSVELVGAAITRRAALITAG
jgi:hypothetical protein